MLHFYRKISNRLSAFRVDLLNQIYSNRPVTNLGLPNFMPNWSESHRDVIPKLTVFNQRHIPACVAHSTVTMMQIEWYKRTGKMINFSPRFLDVISWTSNLKLNDGRHPEVVMDLATRVGCCTEDLLPNDTTLPVEKYRDRRVITKAMYEEASKYRMINLGMGFQTLFDSRRRWPLLKN